MYAIVEIAGQQFKVEKDQKIFVNRLDSKEGSKITLDNVLLIDNGDKVKIGTPKIAGAVVTAKVLEHLKGEKVVVFKKKRRKGYRVKNGHRSYLSKIEIQKIDEKASSKVVAKDKVQSDKVVSQKDSVKETETKKTVAKKTTAKKTVAKKTTAKKTVAKKTVAKKTTAKKTTAKKTTAKKTTAKKTVAKKDKK